MKNYLSRSEIDESKFEVGQCSKHGFFISARKDLVGGWCFVSNCPSCEAEAKARRILSQSLIPLRFKDKNFSTYLVGNSGQATALQGCKDFAKTVGIGPACGKNLVLVGKPGTGKTHLACAILTEVAKTSFLPVLYCTVDRILSKIKSSWNNSSSSQEEMIEKFASVELLTIDEIGTYRSITPLDKDLMFSVIDRRYNNKKPTIFISNLDLTGENSVESYLEDRSFDRVCEDATVIFFEWLSYRRKL